MPFYAKEIKAKEYSYLISYQSSSYYASRLLGSSYRKSVAKNGRTVYTAGYSKRLQIPKEGKSNDHQYLYQNYLTSPGADGHPGDAGKCRLCQAAGPG